MRRELPEEEVNARVADEERKRNAELLAKVEQDDRDRPFNLPHGSADFDYWSKAAHWTLDEALGLSFGKAPERVTWHIVQQYVPASPLPISISADGNWRSGLWFGNNCMIRCYLRFS